MRAGCPPKCWSWSWIHRPSAQERTIARFSWWGRLSVCKLCSAPFHGIGRPIAGLLGRRPPHGRTRNSAATAETIARTYRGGAEVELTLLFADVRGSTTLAERMTASEFSRLINRFYDVATHVLIDSDGWIDKLVGDEVIVLYLPFLEDHPARAVRAAQELMRATGQGSPAGPWIPVGIGIQTGTAFVGTVGSEDTVTDFTALGDAVNVATRLVSAAAAGEILVSNATYSGTGLMLEDLERRELALKVRTEPVGVRVMRVTSA